MEDGAIIRLSYDMWLEEHDGLFDTTDRDRASESGIYNPQHNYGPMITVVGSGRMVPGLEKAVKEQGEVGKEVTVELSAAESFGERDAKRIETVPMQRLKQAKMTPKVGDRIRYKDQPATITRVSGGRVWIDTNSPLAGRGTKYTFKVEEIIEGPASQAQAILEMGYKRGMAFTYEMSDSDKTVTITVPEEAKYDQHFIVAKFRIAHDIGRYTSIEKVRFVEEFTTKPVATGDGDVKATDLNADETEALEGQAAEATN